MPPNSVNVSIVPEVLVWARESVGLSQAELSRKMKVNPEVVREWENTGTPAEVTVRQMEDLARHIRRPTAALLLKQPPPSPPMPRDFRRPGNQTAGFSSELRLATRRARRFQSLARNLPSLGGGDALDIPRFFRQTTGPDDAAVQTRNLLEIPADSHTRWKDPRAAFRGWRSLIEAQNVLVFSSDFPRDEAQGFSISDRTPWVIAVSAKDSHPARCFTLWHEFGHLLLRDGGLCSTDASEENPDRAHHLAPEDWCNRFAEALLVGDDELRERPQTVVVSGGRPGNEAALRQLATHFRVSQQVILFRMLHLKVLPLTRFRREFSRLAQDQARAQSARTNTGGARNVAREVVQERGQRFAQAVLQAYDRGTLSRSEVADYLGARSKHLENIRREAHR